MGFFCRWEHQCNQKLLKDRKEYYFYSCVAFAVINYEGIVVSWFLAQRNDPMRFLAWLSYPNQKSCLQLLVTVNVHNDDNSGRAAFTFNDYYRIDVTKYRSFCAFLIVM